ncbi:polyketide synthase [Paenibacillus sp. CCS19]|uniref:SDR family NAD(P)-dependent oxidoreductase n=1 Tax=Paenibacillus sp. CCS19 TaxID=3158387 RepID=UPI002564B911|nr:SDR family NAD(P)-dependent oxidoreductase [Paenibacillus cellulosilyticus]GMK39956.1 polyketide synthase [Paenibacillus cellulosilyticus]
MEPIALIGMSCRLPGADNPEQYWHLLTNQMNMIEPIPVERWNPDDFDYLDYKVSKHGSFLHNVREFDALFFGISPREAAKMDPQQRLLLETCWEALEHAGIRPASLEGRKVGVFVGAMNADYGNMQIQHIDDIDAFTGPGSQLAITANRISYFFDFRGPSLSIDTACSSSLVAIHEACQSLRSGDSSPLAIACGVNIILSPAGHVFFSKAGVLSADGNIRTFDAAANGFSRGEGVGVVVLKRLSDAERDGDPIIAVIRGSAVNQDGRTNGIMAPNRFSQEKVLAEAYQNAGVKPGDIQYVELHGTGTLLGDPIEANALGTVLAEGRNPEEPCLVGSVKSNIGHLESAAGIAGFIKTALMLQHKQIVPSLHFDKPNPYIPFDSLPLQVATERRDWTSSRTRLAGVSAFGFGGTNAHVVLEEAPAGDERLEPGQRPIDAMSHLLPLSARSESSLRKLVQAYLERIQSDQSAAILDLCYSASVRRTHHPYRICFVFQDIAELIVQLNGYLDGKPAAVDICTGKAGYAAKRICYVFSGQGPQWWGMARDLLNSDPVFRKAVVECNDVFQSLSGISLLEEWQRDEADSRMNETSIAQPALFALQVGIAAKLLALGIRPNSLIGHSLGEVTAAYLSGALSLTDALKVIYYRSLNMQEVTGRGRMLAVLASEREIAQILSTSNLAVDIAAVNGPQSTVVCGSDTELRAFENELHNHSIACTYLPVNYAFHSRQLLTYADKLQSEINGIAVMPPAIPVYSTLTGKRSDDRSFAPHYWAHQMCSPVLFEAAVHEALHAGDRIIIEISPHPVLIKPIKQIIESRSKAAESFYTLNKSEDDRKLLNRLVSQLYCQGIDIDWHSIHEGGKWCSLPSYPWQHERYWLEPNNRHSLHASRTGYAANANGLLGSQENLPAPLRIDLWKSVISERRFPWINDHVIQNAVVLPGAAYVEMIVSALHQSFGSSALVLSELKTTHALFLEPEHEYELHLSLKAEESFVEFAIHSARVEQGTTEWLAHASGTARIAGSDLLQPSLDIPDLLQRCSEPISGQQFYQSLFKYGFFYGETFQNVKQVWTAPGGSEIVAKIELAASLIDERNPYLLHPALLDACGHSLLATERSEASGVYMPTGIDEVRMYEKLPDQVWCVARKRANETRGDQLIGDITICDDNGQVLVMLEGVCFQIMPETKADSLLYEPRFVLRSGGDGLASARLTGMNLIFTDQVAFGTALAAALQRYAEASDSIIVRPGTEYQVLEPNLIEMDIASREQMHELMQFAEQTGIRPTRAILFQPSEPDDAASIYNKKLYRAVHLTQHLIDIRSRHPLQLWILTSGGVCVENGEELDPYQSPYWGYARSLEVEMPELFGGIIDIAKALTVEQATSQAAKALSVSIAGTFAAYRNGARYERELLPITEARNDQLQAESIAPDTGTWLITGGLGGIGLALATWAAKQGSKHLALIGRRQLPDRDEWSRIPEADPVFPIIQAIERIEALGANVWVGSADVTNLDSLLRLKERLKELNYPSIRQVYHLAGIAQGQSIALTDEQTWHSIIAPKIEGTVNLHRLLEDEPLDAFILFSSASTIIGSPMLSAYASGNAFLDAFAHYRQSLGMKATSINWGPWAEVGMASSYKQQDSHQFGALKLLQPEDGLRMLKRIAAYPHPQVSAVRYAEETIQPEESRASIAIADSDNQTADIESYLLQAVANTLRIQKDRVDPHISLLSLGFDSLLTMELKRKIDSAFRIQLPLVSLLQGPSIAKLGAIVQQQQLQEVAAAAQQDFSPEAAKPDQPVEESIDAEQLLEQLDDLTDEEIERLLQRYHE